MAQAWTTDFQAGDGWLAAELRENCYAVRPSHNAPLLAISASAGPIRSPILQLGQGESWLFLLPPDTRAYVNGQRLSLGMRVLRDLDEILLPMTSTAEAEAAEPQRLFFSTERLAMVQPFPGAEKPVFCSRCKDLIQVGQLAVRCPSGRCGLWHHETAEQPCWTYAEKCSNCDQATALDAGYRWTPDQL